MTVLDPIRYDATAHELQDWLLTGICVAGKTAIIQEAKLTHFYQKLYQTTHAPKHALPIPLIARLHAEGEALPLWREAGLGKYTVTTKLFDALAQGIPDLLTCPLEALLALPGVGQKTARFFILFTREGAQVACLDTHILRFLREQGVRNVPQGSVSSPARYRELEQIFLKRIAKMYPKLTPAQADFQIWKNARKQVASEGVRD